MEKLGRRLWLCPLLAIALSACAPMGGRDGGMGRGPDMGGPGERGMGSPGGGAQTVVDQLQNRLRSTAEQLKLTPKQLPLWDNYQEKVGALMSDMFRTQPYRAAHQNALQQIGGKVGTVRNRLAAMEDLAEAAAKLDESLDDGQKKVADRMLPVTVPNLYSGFVSPESQSGGGLPQGMRSGGMGGPMGGGGGMGGPMGGRF